MVTSSQISTLTASASGAAATRSRVVAAIKQASEKSGVDFSYLMAKATQESGLNPSAKASGSSATGLYQFIDQTWLKTIKENGEKYGLGDVADKISVGSDGVARVANAADKKAILELRKNPEVSAEMAAELAKSNKEQLQAEVGGEIGSTELYLAHFLGAGGASDLLNAMKTNPGTKAADLLPQAAAANKSVFYDKTTGAAKSVSQVYQQFAKKFDGNTLDRQTTQIASASASGTSTVAETQNAARKAETAIANEVASTSLAGSLSGGVTLANGVNLDNTISSPFATMILAQMDMDNFGARASDSDAGDRLSKSDDTRRKSVLKTLSDAA